MAEPGKSASTTQTSPTRRLVFTTDATAGGESSNNGTTRRDFSRRLQRLPERRRSWEPASRQNRARSGRPLGRKISKVLDFRCRPPLKPYSGLYRLRVDSRRCD
jgi:hypothetical protein